MKGLAGNQFVIEAISAAVGKVYLVGGTVRGMLMGLESSSDLDFATPLLPQVVQQKLEENGMRTRSYSMKYGTVSTTISGIKIEITTFRNEQYSEGSRNPKVTFAGTIDDDLSRRDFTVNAIAYDGRVYIDPYGGREDIKQHRLRAVGDPFDRLNEDPLRILRAIRFVSQLGFSVDPDLFDAMVALSKRLTIVANERISSEIEKIVGGDNWIRAISLILELGLLESLYDIVIPDDLKSLFIDELTDKVHEDNVASSVSKWVSILSALHTALRDVYGAHKGGEKLYGFLEALEKRLLWPREKVEEVRAQLSEISRAASIDTLYDDLNRHEDGDPIRNVILERIKRIEIVEAFFARKFDQVERVGQELLLLRGLNINERIVAGEEEDRILAESVPYVGKTLSYLLAIRINKLGYIENEDDLNMHTKTVLSGFTYRKNLPLLPAISKQDMAQFLERGLFMLMRVTPGIITNMHPAEIAEKNLSIPPSYERTRYIRGLYFGWLRDLKKSSSSEDSRELRSLLNMRLSEYTLKLNDGVKSDVYYNDLCDAQLWSVLASREVNDAWQKYDTLSNTLDLADNYRSKNWISNGYIYDAVALTHILELTHELSDQKSIVCALIADYSFTKGKNRRNVMRYQLLFEWLCVVEAINKAKSCKEVADITQKINGLSTFNYEDEDEEYARRALTQLGAIKTRYRDLIAFGASLVGQPTRYEIYDSGIRALTLLVHTVEPQEKTTLAMLRDVLHFATNTRDVAETPIEVGSSDVEKELRAFAQQCLDEIRGGETNCVEFKASWEYDLKSNTRIPVAHLKKEVMRAVAALLNTDGGRLYIGVVEKDDRAVEIVGLEQTDFQLIQKDYDVLKKRDEYMRKINSSFRSAFGTGVTSGLSTRFIVIQEKTLFVIEVEKSTEPVEYDKCFYIRNANETVEEKNFSERLSYITRRFPNYLRRYSE